MKIAPAGLLVVGLFVSASTIQADDDFPVKKTLSLETALKAVAAAEAEATRRGATVVIAVVDDGGHLVVLHRLDDTQVASVEVGIGKARTAAIFRRPSKVIGAIGVSGNTPEEDEDIAKAGAAALK